MSMYLNTNNQITFLIPTIFKQITLQIIVSKRYSYKVQHNDKRQIFYIKLENTAEKAVLLYRKKDNILDMQSINVPTQYTGRGLARLLAETAITYAVLNNYRLILTCTFMQRFYASIKNPELEKLVIGPSNILSSSTKNK